jgi:cyclic nucleotide gated channel alpha 1
MTTVGYGDVRANTAIEALYVSATLLISCGFFSYSFGLIGMLIQDLNSKDSELNEDMRTLNRYFH